MGSAGGPGGALGGALAGGAEQGVALPCARGARWRPVVVLGCARGEQSLSEVLVEAIADIQVQPPEVQVLPVSLWVRVPHGVPAVSARTRPGDPAVLSS